MRISQLHEVNMTKASGILKGTIHGKTIELEQAPGLPDGEAVSVILKSSSPAGDGLRRAFGAWASESTELDQFLEQIRRDRKQDRPVIDPAKPSVTIQRTQRDR
jgi:hypothetical protein